MRYRGPNSQRMCVEIGDKHGPFDLAMVPIWRGGSLSWVTSLGLRVRPFFLVLPKAPS